ncbi:MAG: class I SAM-dependent methyltransferase [Acidimicrobiales bacterium]
MTDILDEIYESGTVLTPEGVRKPLHSAVNRLEGQFLEGLIHDDPSIRNVLEIGCAYGLSSLHILRGLAGRDGAHHTIVDPFQHEMWEGIGIANIERAGLTGYSLVEERSEVLLPQLAAQQPGSFDLIFIDGWHTFDHTLVELFFANLMIREGGYIVVDDCSFSSVAKAVSYLEHYPAYTIHRQSPTTREPKRLAASLLHRLLPEPIAGAVLPRTVYDRIYVRTMFSTMVALQKVAPDERDWDWFAPF